MSDFVKGGIGSRDFVWIFFYFAITIFALVFLIIDPIGSDFARIYTNLAYITFIMIILGAIALTMKGLKGLPFTLLVFGDKIPRNKFILSIAAGLGVSLLLIGTILFGFKSFLAPLSFPSLAAVGIGALGSIGAISILVAEWEETFRSSTLLPSVINFIEQTGFNFVVILMGFITYFMFNIQIVGLGLMGFGIILFVSKSLRKQFENKYISHGIGIVAVGIVFASLHLLAYGSSGILLLSAFIYAVIADTINIFLKNTISSRISHCTNNAVLAAQGAGINPLFGLFITGIYILILFTINEVNFKAK